MSSWGTFSEPRTFSGDPVLGSLWEQLVWQSSAQPYCLEHGADDVDVVEIVLLEEVDIEFCNNLSATESRRLTTQHVNT